MPESKEDIGDQPDEAPSKSARKRHMLHLQSLGEALLTLNDSQLSRIPLEDDQLLTAIRECRKIRSNSARKRHLQLIGKLMRHVDPIPIEKALQSIHEANLKNTREFHELEQLRDTVLEEGLGGVERVTDKFPAADRQHLRQLVLQHQREMKKQKPPAASRKLFRYLRELQES